MNNERRKKIEKLINQLNLLKRELQEVLDDEQFSFDNMPENLQSSMRGMISEEAIEYLQEAVDALENIG